MNKSEADVLALIQDLSEDATLDILLDYEYCEMDDMFYIYHNVVNNDFNESDTFNINTTLVWHLDSKGIINYTFGYSDDFADDGITISFDFSRVMTKLSDNKISYTEDKINNKHVVNTFAA